MPETGLRSNKGHKDAPSDKREKSFRFHRYTRFKFRPTDFPIPTRYTPATTSGFPCAATNRTCRSTDRYPEPAFILLAHALSLDSACSIFCFLLFFVLMTFFYSPGRTPTLSSACIQSLRTTVRKARFWAGKYRSEARTIFPSKFTTILLQQKSTTETETCRRTSLSLLY